MIVPDVVILPDLISDLAIIPSTIIGLASAPLPVIGFLSSLGSLLQEKDIVNIEKAIIYIYFILKIDIK